MKIPEKWNPFSPQTTLIYCVHSLNEAWADLLMGALAGADIFGHFGIAGVDQAASLAMLVLQHEVIGYIERVCDAFQIDEETLGLARKHSGQ